MANRGMEKPRKLNVNDEVDAFSSDDENGRKIHSVHVDSAINQWVKVEDPSTKRSFYWNRETGEMKKS